MSPTTFRSPRGSCWIWRSSCSPASPAPMMKVRRPRAGWRLGSELSRTQREAKRMPPERKIAITQSSNGTDRGMPFNPPVKNRPATNTTELRLTATHRFTKSAIPT